MYRSKVLSLVLVLIVLASALVSVQSEKPQKSHSDTHTSISESQGDYQSPLLKPHSISKEASGEGKQTFLKWSDRNLFLQQPGLLVRTIGYLHSSSIHFAGNCPVFLFLRVILR